MPEKLSRKELKAPDSFQKIGAEAGNWLIERRQTVLIGLLLVLVGGAGAAIINHFSVRGEARAARALGEALQVLDRPVAGTQEAQAQANAPSAQPPFSTTQERDQEVVRSLSEFQSAHAGKSSGALAGLPLAQAALRLGQVDKAIEAFDAFLKDARPGDPLRAIAYEGKGYAHEQKGELELALAAFEKLSAEDSGEFLKGMGSYHRARILILQGKKEEAAKQLAEISESAPESAAARLAKERLALLATEGIKPPTTTAAPPASPPNPTTAAKNLVGE